MKTSDASELKASVREFVEQYIAAYHHNEPSTFSMTIQVIDGHVFVETGPGSSRHSRPHQDPRPVLPRDWEIMLRYIDRASGETVPMQKHLLATLRERNNSLSHSSELLPVSVNHYSRKTICMLINRTFRKHKLPFELRTYSARLGQNITGDFNVQIFPLS